jgi:hypothetical protein
MDVMPCDCPYLPERMWTSHYGAVEPGSQFDWNPFCPVHGETPIYAEVADALDLAGYDPPFLFIGHAKQLSGWGFQ